MRHACVARLAVAWYPLWSLSRGFYAGRGAQEDSVFIVNGSEWKNKEVNDVEETTLVFLRVVMNGHGGWL